MYVYMHFYTDIYIYILYYEYVVLNEAIAITCLFRFSFDWTCPTLIQEGRNLRDIPKTNGLYKTITRIPPAILRGERPTFFVPWKIFSTGTYVYVRICITAKRLEARQYRRVQATTQPLKEKQRNFNTTAGQISQLTAAELLNRTKPKAEHG